MCCATSCALKKPPAQPTRPSTTRRKARRRSYESSSGGWADDCTDHEIVAGIQLLAETEGIFTETAGGVAVAVAKKLVQQGRIKQADLTVIAITGNGLKTLEALDMAPPQVIEPKLAAFEQAFRGAYHVA